MTSGRCVLCENGGGKDLPDQALNGRLYMV